MYLRGVRRACAIAGATLGFGAPTLLRATDEVSGHLMLVNENGAWSWFEDERAIVDAATGNVLVGSIGDASGAFGAARDGRVDAVSFNLATRRPARFNLGTIQADDHNTPGLLVRPDGRYLAVYANHNSDRLTRYRVSINPGDAAAWGPERTFDNGIGTTYSNVFRLSAEGTTYNFTRTVGFDPNYLVSSDDGSTWAYGGHLLQDPGGAANARPYVKYASNGADKIHFTTTEAHPRDFSNGVYHGYIQNGKMYKTDGKFVANLGDSPAANAFTPLLAPNTVINGTARTNGWTTDVALDATGNPYAVFTSRVAGDTTDHRLYYGKWTGTAWQVNEVAKMGAGLYASEGDYTGLAAIDPRDPGTLYVSTNVDPRTDAALAKHEIFKATTRDNGATWNWTPVTQNSTVENLRPVVANWGGGTALFWMRGLRYTSYTDFDMGIVGRVEQDGKAVGPIHYTDATPANTAPASGGAATFTGPGPAQGAADNLWHRRTGFGNANEVFTAGEGAQREDAPRLRTTVAGVGAGEYDVFVFFWANPSENWQLMAGLTDAEVRVYRQDQAQQATAEEFDGPITRVGSTVNLYQAYLGRVKVGPEGTLDVWVDDSALTTGGNTRTWYDGVGLARVTGVPEPRVGGALGGTAGILLKRRRGRPTRGSRGA